MSDLRRFDDRAWDRLFEFLHPPVTELSDQEVKAELQKARIDITRALRRVQQAIESQKARALYAHAQQTRPGVVTQLREIVSQHTDAVVDRIQQVRQLLQETPYAAYAYKLQKTSTDKDLESILTDLERLEALERVHEHGSETE